MCFLMQVKQAICDGCTEAPVIKKVKCRHCASAPEMKKPMSDEGIRNVKAGQKFVLKCVAKGSPQPEYTWFMDGKVRT